MKGAGAQTMGRLNPQRKSASTVIERMDRSGGMGDRPILQKVREFFARIWEGLL